MSRKFSHFIIGSICLAVLASVPSAWGVLNNGFETDYVYIPRTSDGDYRDTATIRIHQESDGAEVATWDDQHWTTLTFSGTGTNDTRLFVAQPTSMLDRWYGTDIVIGELNASGGTVKTVNLSSLTGATIGPKVDLGNIRYNRYHGTLIVSATPDGDNWVAGMAWEVDLGLTTLIHTYQGATTQFRPVNTAFDEHRGNLYMGSRAMGGTTDLGDLIVFNTVGRTPGGTTNTYTTVIDGPTKYTSDNQWYKPVAPIYRAGDASRGDGTDTVLDLTGAKAGGAQTFEAYLDTVLHPVDANGNLSRRTLSALNYLGYNGQQDDYTGEVWWANLRNGFSVLMVNDTVVKFSSGWDWWDVDSPPYFENEAPVITEVTPDPDDAYPNVEYVEQLTLTQGYPAPTWSLVQGPTGAVVDSTGRVSGWTPTTGNAGSYFTFEVQATNSEGSDTESWQVLVIGDPPIINDVTPDPDSVLSGHEYTETLTISQGALPITWSLVTGPTGAHLDGSIGDSTVVSGWTPGTSDIGSLFTFTVQASNLFPPADTESWQVRVDPVEPLITNIPSDPDLAVAGTEYIVQLSDAQGDPPATWSLLQGPEDAQIDQTGRISGWTPVTADYGNSFTFEVKAENIGGSNTALWHVEVSVSNNGFLTGYVYTIRSPGDTPVGGTIRKHKETDGVEVLPRFPADDWMTLTFSGVGKGNDARLFVAKPLNVVDGWNGTDIGLGELDAEGTTLKTVSLSTLTGQAIGPLVNIGNIRYNRFHNTLIVSANTNNAESMPAMAWEVDLELTTLIHTYQGPLNFFRAPNTAFDERTGKLYMTSRNLGGEEDLGDVVAFDTATRAPGGTTSNPPVVIDGPTMNASDEDWWDPHAPMYRAGDPGRDDGTDTLLFFVGGAAGARALYEVWLDTDLHPVDGDGNLARRPQSAKHYLGYNGQQDEASGNLWYANYREGFGVLRTDETSDTFLTSSDWWDIDSPPYELCSDPFADADDDGDVDQDDFAVFQVCYTGPGPGPGVEIPSYPAYCGCFDIEGDKDIDQIDYAEFQACASGPGIAADPACDDGG